MKKLTRLMLLMLLCTTAFTMVSCLNDDDDNSIDEATRSQYFAAIKGSFMGKIYFYNDTITKSESNKTDSVMNVNVTFSSSSDTLITIRNFPGWLVAKNVTNKDLQDALKDQNKDLRAHYSFFQKASAEVLTFPLSPVILEYDATYGGSTHKVKAVFYSNYSYGQYSTSSRRVYIQTCLAAIYVDEKLEYNFINDGNYAKTAIVVNAEKVF